MALTETVTTATMITAPETAVAGPTVAEVMAAADTATVGEVIDLSFERGDAWSSGPPRSRLRVLDVDQFYPLRLAFDRGLDDVAEPGDVVLALYHAPFEGVHSSVTRTCW